MSYYKDLNETLHWLDNDDNAHLLPAQCVYVTDEEAKTILAGQQQNLTDYRRKRAAEYPDFRDYLDGVVKDDAAQIAKYIADCNAVKIKYPKQ